MCTANKNALILGVTIASLMVASCGHRTFTPRSANPLLEDRVRMGDSNDQKMSVLTSRADRRTILVFGKNEVCAEPSPDVAEAISSQTSAQLASKEQNVSAGSSLQTALLQLSRRSQGLDFYRTGSFVNCMRYYTGGFGIGDDAVSKYNIAMQDLFEASTKMTLAEIDKLPAIATAIAQVSNPTFPIARAAENSASEPKAKGTDAVAAPSEPKASPR